MEYLKDKVFNTNSHIIDDLKEALQQEGFSTSTETLQAILWNFII
jgi:hypothetical protein